jgi:hypothetical protein
MKKIILHLCADVGSDSRYYQLDENYDVILVGEDIGVENFNPPDGVYGVIANPVCTEFSTVGGFDKKCDIEKGMFLVNHCLRIIDKCSPSFWVIENPAKGRLREKLGKPTYTYQPWHYGSPWTKQTALWGEFNIPDRKYKHWEDVPGKLELWKRKDRDKPCLAYLHKSAKNIIPEFEFAKDKIDSDMDLRSMCSQGFAKAFYDANR